MATVIDTDALWQVLESVPDPEIPVVSVVDLGIVRDGDAGAGDDHPDLYRLPATQVIERDIRDALDAAGFRDVAIETALSPPWTTDWISESGKAKLHAYGIAPPSDARDRDLPAMRLHRHRGAQPLRLDALQGAVALPRLPRAVRPVQVPLMSVSFHKLTVAEVVDETAEARSIRFAVPEELRETFHFKPGQHLTLKAEIGGEEVRRNYSLCVAPQDGQVTVTVKRIAGGLFSNWANDSLKPGDAIEVMAPHGSFTWDFSAGAANHYVGFAGGSGITPVISLLKTALLTEPDSRFTLFYGNRDSSSIIFLEALAAAQEPLHGPARGPSFPRRGGGGVRAVQRHARPRQMRRDPRDADRSGGGRRLLHLRARADDGCGRGGAARARRREGADPSRALHRRPSGRGAAGAACGAVPRGRRACRCW